LYDNLRASRSGRDGRPGTLETTTLKTRIPGALQRRDFAALLAAGLLPAGAMAAPRAADPGPALKTLGAAKGLRVGNAIGMQTFADPRYRALMLRECDTMVTENECKWQIVAPRSPEMDFRDSDRLLAWGARAGLNRRGHCLVWQPTKWLPKWLVDHDFGAQPALEAERLLVDRIRGACTHYGDQIYSWDVVNEAIDQATGEFRVNVLTQAMGAVEQLDLCFRLARESAPHAQLVYNDFMHWDAGSARHRAGVLKLLNALKSRGTPIDALGLQSHISAPAPGASADGTEQREWRKFLDEVSAMGLQLLITEFDVNDRNLPADIAARDAGVAAAARDYLDVTFSYPNLGDFLFWGLTDSQSWLQKWPGIARHDSTEMRPAPFDDRYRPKRLREAVADAMRAMPARVVRT
jgi:endo-1,4-beta-xylanase